MNKTQVLTWLTFAVKILSVAGGLSAYMSWIPPKYAAFAVLAFGIASATKDFFLQLGDWLDDGMDNDSFK